MTSGESRFRLHRPLDVLVSVVGLVVSSPALVLAWIAASRSTKGTGLFRQARIGRGSEPFEIFKFRTMEAETEGSTVTTADDSRITRVGHVLRRTKLDEVPQLINVFRGEMSLIGPRPDVAGFADNLRGEDRAILRIRPGITGPASVLFANEENILAEVNDPIAFNANTLYPTKTAINRAWIEHGSLTDDLKILLWTVKRPSESDIQALIYSWNSTISLEIFEENVGA